MEYASKSRLVSFIIQFARTKIFLKGKEVAEIDGGVCSDDTLIIVQTKINAKVPL